MNVGAGCCLWSLAVSVLVLAALGVAARGMAFGLEEVRAVTVRRVARSVRRIFIGRFFQTYGMGRARGKPMGERQKNLANDLV
jgi:hypothetical protein